MRSWGVVAVSLGFLAFLAFLQACPTVAVVIPETVIIERIPRPIPDPAAETAIIREFLNYGFNVVDLPHVKLLRATPDGLKEVEDLAKRAFAGDLVAIRKLAARDGVAVDVLVVGEAVSTVTVFEALQIPGRQQVQDGRARVEVRAIEAVPAGSSVVTPFIPVGLTSPPSSPEKSPWSEPGTRSPAGWRARSPRSTRSPGGASETVVPLRRRSGRSPSRAGSLFACTGWTLSSSLPQPPRPRSPRGGARLPGRWPRTTS